ncbi:hypothetical protein PoB_002194400 [Plakobranchus ocellatus]|uniref:Uncharacterized protein n=1 Tax=Plakobranchus ocellatus TaxID=259542 RepID=A0AAV3ZNJ4_9GAST|nr:hypothetical protein PoB_002194400 [Plakobranchus ocellatus]
MIDITGEDVEQVVNVLDFSEAKHTAPSAQTDATLDAPSEPPSTPENPAVPLTSSVVNWDTKISTIFYMSDLLLHKHQHKSSLVLSQATGFRQGMNSFRRKKA